MTTYLEPPIYLLMFLSLSIFQLLEIGVQRRSTTNNRHNLLFTVYFLELSDIQREYRDVAMKFAKEKIIPVAAHYDSTGEVSS